MATLLAGNLHCAAAEGVDFIWAGLVLHCMPQANCEALFRNSHSMLKPGGVLYGTTAGRLEGATEWDYTKDASRTGMLYSPVGRAPTATHLGVSMHIAASPAVHKVCLQDQYAIIASSFATLSMCFICTSEVQCVAPLLADLKGLQNETIQKMLPNPECCTHQ